MNAKIPILNIYYLYCYAWERFSEGRALISGGEVSPDLPNLLTRVLLNGMQGLFRRGLDRAYHPIQEELTTVRGHIELSASLRLQARNARRLQCSFDELSYDVLHNQILKATLKRLCANRGLQPALSIEAKLMVGRLQEVSDIRLTESCFARVQLHRNNGYYDLLLRIAQLAFAALLPVPGGSEFRFKDVLSDEREMARVFESFVRNFYRAEQNEFQVEPLTILWDAVPITRGTHARLPQMRVDVFLRSPGRQIIIDTKYYAEALQTYRGSSSFRSAHLYQIYSYLKNHADRVNPKTSIDGILIYPQVGEQIDASYDIQGHSVRITTLDLAAQWQDISKRLLELLAPFEARGK